MNRKEFIMEKHEAWVMLGFIIFVCAGVSALLILDVKCERRENKMSWMEYFAKVNDEGSTKLEGWAWMIGSGALALLVIMVCLMKLS